MLLVWLRSPGILSMSSGSLKVSSPDIIDINDDKEESSSPDESFSPSEADVLDCPFHPRNLSVLYIPKCAFSNE